MPLSDSQVYEAFILFDRANNAFGPAKFPVDVGLNDVFVRQGHIGSFAVSSQAKLAEMELR